MPQQLNISITKKNLFLYALPTLIGLVFTSAYSIVDGMFVSQFINTTALSAVNIIFPLIMLPVVIGMMMASGGSAVVARKIGSNQLVEAREIFSFLAFILTITSVLLSLLALIFFEPLLLFLGANRAIYPYAYEYGLWTLLLLPLAIVGIYFQILFITAGKSNLVLISTISAGVINIALDYVFIVIFGWGIRGAAIATGIGYAIPFVLGGIYFTLMKKNTLHLIKPVAHWRALFTACLNGFSEMVVNVSQAIVTFLLNAVMIQLAGEDGVAAITIILYGQTFLAADFMGYSTGIAPIISFKFGSNRPQEIAEIFRHSKHFICGFALITFSCGIIFAESLVSFFTNPTSSVFNLSVLGFRYSAFAFLLMGFNIFGSAFFTAMSNGKTSALIAFMRTFIFQISAIIICAASFGVTGVFLALPIAEVLGLIITIFCFKKHQPNYRLI
ncbi:MAG: MATE family efflux transporter [Culicoidibacterales bacterium]